MFNEISQETIQSFFPEAQLHSMHPIGEGLINETYLITLSNKEQWVLQRINTTLFQDPAALMGNFLSIAKHLQKAGIYPLRIIHPNPTTSGKYHHFDSTGNCWRVLPYFEDTFAPVALPNPEEAYQAARAYGFFFHALTDFNPNQLHIPLPGFHDTISRFDTFRNTVLHDPAKRLKEVDPEVRQIFDAEHYAIQVQQLIASGTLPLRVTHNDTKAGNVLLNRSDKTAAAVIDWDTVMPGTVLSDYGDMVRTFVPDRHEDAPTTGIHLRTDVWEALDKGFLETAGSQLSPAEKQHLHLGAKWIITEQALRFLTDYIAGDMYYKIKYPQHNLDRAKNQLAILRLMED